MILEHAILGFLNYRSMTGYELKKLFDRSVRHFWPADQGQIYRALNRISAEGWTGMEVVEQQDRPDRKVYHISPEGKTELRRWLLAPIQMPENRSAAMVQVFFAGQLSDAEIQALFERTAAQMRAGLAILESVPQDFAAYQDTIQSPREFYLWKVTLEIGIESLRSNLRLAEDLAQRVKNGELPPHASIDAVDFSNTKEGKQ